MLRTSDFIVQPIDRYTKPLWCVNRYLISLFFFCAHFAMENPNNFPINQHANYTLNEFTAIGDGTKIKRFFYFLFFLILVFWEGAIVLLCILPFFMKTSKRCLMSSKYTRRECKREQWTNAKWWEKSNPLKIDLYDFSLMHTARAEEWEREREWERRYTV